MARNQFSDIIPPGGKRSIRDIPLPNDRKREPVQNEPEVNETTFAETDEPVEIETPQARPQEKPWGNVEEGHFSEIGRTGPKKKSGKLIPIICAVVGILLIVWGVSFAM